MKKIAALFLFVSAISCNQQVKKDEQVTINKLPEAAAFQQVVEGKKVDLYLLKNKQNMSVYITNYGGRIVSLNVPDRKGTLKDVVLGFDSLQHYFDRKENFFGALIGRYGNRIAKGIFQIDGQQYHLPINNIPNTLHGGPDGFHHQIWDAKLLDSTTLELKYVSKDGESGYPGNLTATVTYHLTEENSIEITYEAVTDKKTVVNLTNHSYFNLSGAGASTINDHILNIYADGFTPVDSTLIPTGEIAKVAGTAFDFLKPHAIGDSLKSTSLQIINGKGYDHNFALNKKNNVDLELAATVYAPQTGIQLDVFTQEPGLQFYGGNFLDSTVVGKNNLHYNFRSAFCLETQHFPDAPNQKNFASTILKPGKVYKTKTRFKFSIHQ